MAKRKNSRNAAGSGSIRQRADGKWEGHYSAGSHPGTGKPIRKSVYGDTQREVVSKLAAIQTAIDTGIYIEPSKLTVGQWLDIWTAEYLGGVKPNTRSGYKTSCRVHLKPNFGNVKLSALSTPSIQQLFNRLHKGTDCKKGLSPKTIKNLNGVFHSALQQAVKLGYRRDNPCDAVELPRVEKHEIQPLDEDAIAAFLDAIKGHKWEYLFMVDLFTGLREGELLGLQWSRIDFQSGTILIDRQLQRNRETRTWEIVTPKNDKSRRITPAPSVMAALWEQRRRQMEWRLKAGPMWEVSDLCFTDEVGKNLVARTVVKHYKKIVAGIGIPERRFHDLRHSYAVAALEGGDNIKDVQEALGHHTAAFTLDTYAHVGEQRKRESAARMEEFIKSMKSV